MNLKEFFDYKNQLFKDLLTNEKIVKLINEEKDLSTAEDLAYTQVFPYEYIPETVEHGHTFICCDVDVQVPQTRVATSVRLYYKPILYVWVMSHKSKLRLPTGGVRTDVLCSEIAGAINESLYYGIGGLQLYSVKRFSPMTDYQGKVLTFTADDVNWVYDMNRPVPSNRKKGL